MQSPEVSVVMSVWNGAAVLGETLDSILAQRGVELELVVVDDGSTDDTGSILERYAGQDDRIRILEQENRGLTLSLIRGCAEARAPYIARHDAGDRSHPDRLAKQKAALDDDADLAFVSCWSQCCGPEWEPMFVERGSGGAAAPARILADDHSKGVTDAPSSHPSVMFRREAYERVGGYRAVFRYAQDWDLWYRLASTGAFQMIPEVHYEYRFFPDGVSVGNRRRQNELLALALESSRRLRAGLDDGEVLERVRDVCSRKSTSPPARDLSAGYYFIGETLRRNGNASGRGYLRAAVRHDPLHARAWIRLVQSLIL